ncbi:MAG: hypothetical protein IIB73_09065 [Proteobacteria bacterium]|nr:hypothetical protein [Pseudomonadota bacterium]
MVNHEAIKAIKDHLGKQLGVYIYIQQTSPGSPHRYRIETDPPHWIYISYEFLTDAGADAIKAIIDDQVLDHLQSSTTSQWIAIESKGVKNVDETYGK